MPHTPPAAPTVGSPLPPPPILLDLARRKVTVLGKPVYLTTAQYGALCVLVEAAGKPVTYDAVVAAALSRCGDDSCNRRVITLINSLRHKLMFDPAEMMFIYNTRTVGYAIMTMYFSTINGGK